MESDIELEGETVELDNDSPQKVPLRFNPIHIIKK